MPTFDFVYGCCLGIMLLKQTDNLSRTLQDPKLKFDLKKFTVYDLIKLVQELDYSRKGSMSEVIKAAKILLVMPATNAITERSFSAMKRVKTYLRSTTTDNRMNHLMVLHVQKERLDSTNLIDVANVFVGRVDSRKQIFGLFTKRDLSVKTEVAHKSTQS